MKTKIIGDKNKNIILKKKVNPIIEQFKISYGFRKFKEDPICNGFSNDRHLSFGDVESKLQEYEFTNSLCFKSMDEERHCITKLSQKRGRAEKLEKKEEESKLNLNKKEGIMKMINTQNFVKGFWKENKETKIIKEKYKKEYDLLKGIKDKKISDDVAITIIIIYFLYKEHSELLAELSRIIKKAKLFIKNFTKSTYDDIIKEIGI